MKTLLHEFWTSWHTWALLGCLVLTFAAIIALGVVLQTREYQRVVTTTAVRALADLSKEIQTLKIQNQQSLQDRVQLRQEVTEVKKKIDQVEDK